MTKIFNNFRIVSIFVTSCLACFLMDTAFQDATFNRGQRLSEGGVHKRKNGI